MKGSEKMGVHRKSVNEFREKVKFEKVCFGFRLFRYPLGIPLGIPSNTDNFM